MMEYPRPQFERQEWVSLDGEWTYHIVRRAFFQNMQNDTEENICSSGFPDRIIVPFAPETKLSGADEKEINSLAAELCRRKGIPVNDAGNKENCDFYFPDPH